MNPIPMFQYNWQVRDEWFRTLAELPADEQTKPRTGGHGSMLRTLAHVIAVEHEWVSTLQGMDDVDHNLDDYATLEQVQAFSAKFRPDIEAFLQSWGPEKESGKFEASRFGRTFVFAYSEVVSHLIAHEIHHIGQLSIWAREANRQPPSANVIFRGLFR